MSTNVPAGLRPIYSARPAPALVKLIRAEVRDTVITRSDLPRGYGSQFAVWLS